jgi:hypothetical protein
VSQTSVWCAFQLSVTPLHLWRCGPNAGHGRLMLEVSWSHTTTYQSSGRVISSSQRPLPNNAKHSQQTNIYALRWDLNPRYQQASGRWPTP